MKTGFKIALTTVGAAIVVVVVYRLLKSKTTTGVVQNSENVPVSNNKKIDVGGIGKKVAGLSNVNANKADRFVDVPVVNKADRFSSAPVVNKADRFK